MLVPEVAVLITELQVPVIAGIFVELVGKEGGVLFWHNGPMAANVGVTFGFTVMLIVDVVAHCPAVGVKVYVVVPAVVVLMDAFQVPVIAGIFVELVGKDGGVLFWHKGPIGANVGVIFGFTVILIVAVVAHTPVAGVKV